jgi:hypothetical protein
MLRAVAFLLNGAVFLIGYARFQGRLAPPDYIYVGLLFAAPLVNTAALVLGYRKAPDAEVMDTLRAAALLLNLLLLLFVAWLSLALPPETRRDEAIWIALLFLAPFANTGALWLPGAPPSDRDPA